MVETLAGEYR